MLTRLYNLFSSVKLAVVLLALGLILVFWGTLAQVKLGVFQVQHEFFQSLFIFWQPTGSGLRIPIFPGGYLVGGLLLINLFTAHLRYYKPGARKIGIAMIHLGVVLLLLGQFTTDMLSTESYMNIREGDAANYSESNSRWELAVIDSSDAKEDKVVAIPTSLLAKGGELTHPDMPFKLRSKTFYLNSALSTNAVTGFELVNAQNPFDMQLWWSSRPKETRMDFRDIPSVLVEISAPQGESKTILISGHFVRPQTLSVGGRGYQLVLRPERYYKQFSLQLIDFRFDRYAGTETPKNFSSRVRLTRPEKGEDREITIRMNEPLRYGGETFYQASYDKATEQATILQVVDNPSWLTPYLGCGLVAVGMIWQFLSHLIKFAAKRKTA